VASEERLQGRHFARLAPDYDRLRPLDRNWEETLAALAAEAELARLSVLEVGGGTGRLALALAERYGCSVTVVDASAEMLAVGRARTQAVRFEQAVAEQLPFDDGTFDRVVTYMAVHLFDRPRAFGEFRRVLGADGVAAIATPDPDGFGDSVWAAYFPSFADIDRARFPSARSLVDELSAAGFRAVRVADLSLQRSTSRDDVLAKIRGRAFSTFELLDEDELQAGLRQAEASLPARVTYPVAWLIATATR
jgi:SAM-dependent methyltransferase